MRVSGNNFDILSNFFPWGKRADGESQQEVSPDEMPIKEELYDRMASSLGAAGLNPSC
jgi:hypothetical protein